MKRPVGSSLSRLVLALVVFTEPIPSPRKCLRPLPQLLNEVTRWTPPIHFVIGVLFEISRLYPRMSSWCLCEKTSGESSRLGTPPANYSCSCLKSRPFDVPESLLFLLRVSIRLKHPSDALQILHCNLHKLDEKS